MSALPRFYDTPLRDHLARHRHMGRCLLYRVHAWSVAECLLTDIPDKAIRIPREIKVADWDSLWAHGGFPEPLLKRDIAS